LQTVRGLIESDPCWDIIVVDEAARVPVLWLQRLVERHPQAHLLFATTTTGYEGTGRGFVLRFVAWLKRQARETLEVRPVVPIRWEAGDPLEATLGQALHLHARPALASALPDTRDNAPAHRVVSQEQLSENPVLLDEVFGLLVHAHYRTRPADLHTLLDAPNVVLHVLLLKGHCVAVNLVAREGGLAPERCTALAAGRGRLRGHALADTLITHGGCPRAGALTMIRSVRIATHPELRGRGLGRQLADAVHAHHRPQLFGTLFGATPELLRFRQAQGYRLVRLGAAHGTTTGSPSAVMVRPESDQARAIVTELQTELSRNLPLQLRLLEADGAVALGSELVAALAVGLPPAAPLSPVAAQTLLAGWLDGPRTSDAVIAALRTVVHHSDLGRLPPGDQALVHSRVVALECWRRAAAAAGLPTVRAAQRQLKRAVRKLLTEGDQG
jgi:tRNA(Met) cytidine acetyltransferase